MDEAVLQRLVEHVGGRTGTVYGRKGKPYLRQKIDGFNQAARYSPWVVVVDLNAEADCAPSLCAQWLPDPAPNLCFRVAVREVEAWLLADGETLARFLGVSRRSTSRLIEFVGTEWRPAAAAERSDSLKRAIRCLRQLLES